MFYAVVYRLRKIINPQLFPFHLFSFFFIAVPLCMVVAKSFSSYENNPVSDNFVFVNSLLLTSLLRSLAVAILTLVIVFLVGYPFAYLVANIRSRTRRMVVMSLVSCPLWSSFFVKLIGLKSFFDLLNGELNSTRGLIYVVIGLVYINLPIVILTFYNSISHIPKNIINASLDLGSTRMETVWNIVVPYTYKAMMAVLFLVFLPSIACISVADFMNKSAGSQLIGQVISDWASSGSGGIGVNRLAFVILCLSSMILATYLTFKYVFAFARSILHRRNA